MKVGIITQHRVFNYGSVLQAYATQNAIRKLGHEPEIIDYFSEQRTYFRQFCALPKDEKAFSIKGVIQIVMRLPGNIKKACIFNKFLKKYVCLSKKKYVRYSDLLSDPPIADVYMTGSDQVWNSDYNEGIDPSYYLKFGKEKVKRVSYAASVGMDIIPGEEEDIVKQLLECYDDITVREISAQNALYKLGIKNVKVVLDPTLLLEQYEWERIEKRTKRQKYILVMILYGEECGIVDIAEQMAKDTGLPVLELVWNPLRKRPWKIIYGCSPQEFLGYVHNAEYIITNSFHVTAFAINFKRDFIVVKREKYNNRIESLLEQLGIKNRYIEKNEMSKELLYHIPYDEVEDKLKILREESYKTLKRIIGD